MKKGREEFKSSTRPGRSHRSHYMEDGMGGTGKEVSGGAGCPLHEGQRESGTLVTLCRKLLRKEQYPEWSWKSVERRQRGRSFSSSATAGGGV